MEKMQKFLACLTSLLSRYCIQNTVDPTNEFCVAENLIFAMQELSIQRFFQKQNLNSFIGKFRYF